MVQKLTRVKHASLFYQGAGCFRTLADKKLKKNLFFDNCFFFLLGKAKLQDYEHCIICWSNYEIRLYNMDGWNN